MSLRSPEAPRPDGRGRPRKLTDEKINAAVIELLRTAGPAGVTIDTVSQASGVAKTSLYRRFKDRYEMLEHVAESIRVPSGPTLEPTSAGFTQLLREIQNTFQTQIGLTLVGQVLADRTGFTTTWRERLIGPHVAVINEFFVRGVAVGTLRGDLDYGTVTELILGGTLAADAIRGTLPDNWADTVAAILWPAIAGSASH